MSRYAVVHNAPDCQGVAFFYAVEWTAKQPLRADLATLPNGQRPPVGHQIVCAECGLPLLARELKCVRLDVDIGRAKEVVVFEALPMLLRKTRMLNRYRSQRTGAMYLDVTPVSPDDEMVLDDHAVPAERRRNLDERVEALSLRVDLFAEVQERHMQNWDIEMIRAAQFQADVKAELTKLDSLVELMTMSKRAGRIVLGIAIAVGAIVSWALTTWQQIRGL